jgi:hypothetical protein
MQAQTMTWFLRAATELYATQAGSTNRVDQRAPMWTVSRYKSCCSREINNPRWASSATPHFVLQRVQLQLCRDHDVLEGQLGQLREEPRVEGDGAIRIGSVNVVRRHLAAYLLQRRHQLLRFEQRERGQRSHNLVVGAMGLPQGWSMSCYIKRLRF